MRVLVVEDEVKMASLIRRGLREEGLAADVAVKGEDALWMAGSTDYDSIIMDVMLPDIDGFGTAAPPKPFSFGELLARLRALARRGSIEHPTVIEIGDLKLDPAARRVWRGE